MQRKNQISETRSQVPISFIHCLMGFLPCFLSCFLGPMLFYSICFAEDEEPALSYYEIIEQRNFFRPKAELVVDDEKKDFEEKKISSYMEALKATDLLLTGVVKIKGNYKAILQEKTGEKSFYIKVNDTVEGYTVKDIRDDRVIFQKGGEEFMLNIEGTDSSNGIIIKNAPQTKTETDEENAPQDEVKYEENIMQKMRMGIGGK